MSPSNRNPKLSWESWLTHGWRGAVILVLAVVLVYLPVWWAGYVCDDDVDLTANQCIIGPLGIKEIWTTNAAQFYPLELTTFWIEHALWGLAPLPYHLVNVFLHGACAVVLWCVLRSLQVPGAWLGAALWALHPVEVESVAWIAEMKNTESGLFYLLAILFFVKVLRAEEKQESWGWNFGWTLVFAALALASKSSTIILPIVLCLCAWWTEGRWRWRNLVKIGPIVLLSAFSAYLALRTVASQGDNADSQWALTWPERGVIAGNAVWFYLHKLIWPHPLILFYPRWHIDSDQWSAYLPLLGVIFVVLVLWLKRGSWARPWFFAFAYFLAALLPVLGLVNIYILRYSFVFDHFQYLASMGPLALMGAGMTRLADFIIPGSYWRRATLGAALLLALGTLSWQHVWAFENESTLYSDTLATNPNSWIAYTGLGKALCQEGQPDEAMVQFQKALEINPNCVEALNNLGTVLLAKGQVDEAIEQHERALGINPYQMEAHYNLGNDLVQKGQLDKAIVQYQEALAVNPFDADSHNNLGFALFKKGQFDEAIAQFQQALQINPDDGDALANLAKAQAATSRFR